LHYPIKNAKYKGAHYKLQTTKSAKVIPKNLDNCFFTINFKNLSTPGSSISQTNVNNLLILGSLIRSYMNIPVSSTQISTIKYDTKEKPEKDIIKAHNNYLHFV